MFRPVHTRRIQDQVYDPVTHSFSSSGTPSNTAIVMKPKAIAEEFDTDWGRMTAQLGTELPFTNFLTQTTLQQWFFDPPTEIIDNNKVQIWKITHNGVDTHSVHFHMVNVQLINRVAWDGTSYPPDPNELGWKETVRLNPLTDAIVAIRPIDVTTLGLPFSLPDSYRLLDVTMPANQTSAEFTNVDPVTNNPINTTNTLTNFGWEYVWHCHLLGHEENDMMRPIIFQVPPEKPINITAARNPDLSVTLNWTNAAASATGFVIQRGTDQGITQNVVTFTIDPKVAAGAQLAVGSAQTYNDTTALPTQKYYYQVAASKLFNNQVVSNGVLQSDYALGPQVLNVPSPIASIAPPAVAFTPAQALTTTSAPQTVTVTNSGDAVLNVTSVTPTGDFSAVSSCSAVAPSTSCLISVSFSPKATGARSGMLTVGTNDPAHKTLTVSLSGMGTAILFTPTSVAFGNQLVGSASTARTITMQNVGTATINNIAFSFAGQNPTDYSTGFNAVTGTRRTACTSLAAKATCTLSVRFTPGSNGTSSASVSVASSDPANPVLLPLTGFGATPMLNLNPASLSISSPAGMTTASDTPIIVANPGTWPLTINSIQVTGTGFTATNTCPRQLAVNATCTVTVSFRPTDAQATAGTPVSGSLNVNVAAPASSAAVALTGQPVASTPASYTLSPTQFEFHSWWRRPNGHAD